MKKLTSKRKQIAKIIKKNNAWIGIIFFLFVAFFAVSLWAGLVGAFVYYISESKIMGEYKVISYMAELYEQSGSENPFSGLPDKETRDYIITDSKGNILHQRGEDTRSNISASMEFPGQQSLIKATSDKSTDFLYCDEDGEMQINFQMLYKWFFSDETKESVREENGSRNFYFPIWLEKSIRDGSEIFYGKATVEVRLNDAFFLLLFATVLFVLILIVLVLILVNIISTAVSQKKMVNVFFLDVVTKGHNWIWFLIHGEQTLLRRKYAKNRYAVLDLVFVRYRNFCVCHSVEEGEKMLCKLNSIVSDSLLKDETMAHYASANFAVMLRYTDEEQLRKRIEEIIKKLEGMDGTHRFAFHVGVVPLGSAVETGRRGKKLLVDLEKEYNNACAARATLSETDESGIAFFDQKLVEEQRWIDTVQECQQSALENEEFVVYYQPKYDPRTDELKGAEALIRWDSPEHGFRSPNEIIPIFEKNGFIVNIDRYMITHVARDQKKWLDAGLKCVPVSVNVSRAHFIDRDLAEQIRDMVDAYGTPHELIEIELTESAFFDDKKAMVTTITKLRDYGFHVSMDDFGSGYSSLNSLKDMPLDVLKLDAGFFSGDLDDERGEIVVSEAIKLAKNLNMETVAEGVEAKEQVEFLARQGCDMIQGYFYARPMPKEEYEKRMAGSDDTETRSSDKDTFEASADTAPDTQEEENPEYGY